VALKAASALAVVSIAALTLFASVFTILGTATEPTGDLVCSTSPEANDRIPANYLQLYQRAGAKFRLDWSVLAAIGLVESGHGANVGPSTAGALGPMQFLPATWLSYGVDGNGDASTNVMDPEDAIPGAARLLRANGAPANWGRAIFAYNHVDWYVREVLAQAERYRGGCRSDLWGGGEGRLAWPVRGAVTSPFCERRAWERCHPGIDIAVSSGTAVHAADSGRVTLARPVSGYGNFLCIDHGEIATCYAHLASYQARVGKRVTRGDVIALSDCTGRCFGPHLHLEVRVGATQGRPTDPIPYLEER
jgi:murein DD-endopeptidase MepM/ murein hydrolase activator NlpD